MIGRSALPNLIYFLMSFRDPFASVPGFAQMVKYTLYVTKTCICNSQNISAMQNDIFQKNFVLFFAQNLFVGTY